MIQSKITRLMKDHKNLDLYSKRQARGQSQDGTDVGII